MGTLPYKLRSTPGSAAIYDPDRIGDLVSGLRAPDVDESEDELGDDPFLYGFREIWEKTPDGREKLRQVPLTYEDTLNPQL